MVVEFDPIGHVYRVGGRVCASVTALLTAAGYIPARAFYTPEGRDRGRRVHHATVLIDRGRDPGDVSGIEGEIAGYRKFLADLQPLYTATEQPVSDGRIAGTPDRIVRRLNGVRRLGVLELKTGACAVWHGYQTAGYAYLVLGTERRWCVHLRPQGDYRLHLHDKQTDRYRFLHAVREYGDRHRGIHNDNGSRRSGSVSR